MRASQIALISAGAAVTGVLGYAVYFDYMRRNSPEFRKGLSKSEVWRRAFTGARPACRHGTDVGWSLTFRKAAEEAQGCC